MGNLRGADFPVVLVDSSAFGYCAGAFHHCPQEMGGDLLRLALLELVTAGEVEEGLPGFRHGGEEEAELGELGGATAVLEGVKVARFGAGAGTTAAAPARFVWGLVVWSLRHGCQRMGKTD